MPEKKPFLTYEQQIRKLRDEKGLAIPDEAHAIDILTQIGYFSLINGYKTPFKESATGRYKAGTTFEDIENLYYFDEALRELFFKYLLFARKAGSLCGDNCAPVFAGRHQFFPVLSRIGRAYPKPPG
ncbi:hypothetical protein FACS189450_12190 [Spirochaetia bacterium]|nr:hypothetical protein FACS189450_12190 [Spirochaetia bacterium]